MLSRHVKFEGDPIKVISYTIPDLSKVVTDNHIIDFGFEVGKSRSIKEKIVAIKFNWGYKVFKDKQILGEFIAEDILGGDFTTITFEEFRRMISDTYFRFLLEYQKRCNNKYTFVFNPSMKDLENYYRIINPTFPSLN